VETCGVSRGKIPSAIRARASDPRIGVVYRPIGELKLEPRNPRAHSTRQIRQIARSIETFSFCVPVLVDATLKVVAGHGRVAAARVLGLNEVPTIRLEHLSEAQARAFMIADNRLTENSTWDDHLLAEQLQELSLMELDFSVEVTGFEMAEIDLRIEGLSLEPGGDDPADAIPTSHEGTPVSRAGDQWELGPHRICCGSALDEGAYAALMRGTKAAAIIADPPYNIPIDGNVTGLGSLRHREFVMGAGEMSEQEFIAFLSRACMLLARNSTEGAFHYIFIDWRHLGELLAAGRTAYRELKNICVWVKSNAGMGSLYRSQHELILVFKHGRGPHRNNIELGRFGRNRTNVWNYPGANSFARAGGEGNLLALHPTVKPTAMIADAIMDCTARGDIVLDGFLGSGTTVIAAELTGRRCYGLELDPLYVDTVVRRWQAYTSANATHASTGRCFNDLELERKGQNAG
jgi:DNA modification methylase